MSETTDNSQAGGRCAPALGSDTWEYKILMMRGEMSDTGSLNALGAQGCELIFIKGAAVGIWYYLKRRRPNAPPELQPPHQHSQTAHDSRGGC
jgi:hypothetical protein